SRSSKDSKDRSFISRTLRPYLNAALVACADHIAGGQIRLPAVVAQRMADAIEALGVGGRELQVARPLAKAQRLHDRAGSAVARRGECAERRQEPGELTAA